MYEFSDNCCFSWKSFFWFRGMKTQETQQGVKTRLARQRGSSRIVCFISSLRLQIGNITTVEVSSKENEAIWSQTVNCKSFLCSKSDSVDIISRVICVFLLCKFCRSTDFSGWYFEQNASIRLLWLYLHYFRTTLTTFVVVNFVIWYKFGIRWY